MLYKIILLEMLVVTTVVMFPMETITIYELTKLLSLEKLSLAEDSIDDEMM